MEIDDLTQIKEDLAAVHKAQEPLFNDKIQGEIMTQNVFVTEFQQFPKLTVGNHGIKFDHYLNHKSARDINATRMEYFEQRLI